MKISLSDIYEELYQFRDKKAKILKLVINQYNSYLYLSIHGNIYKFTLNMLFYTGVKNSVQKKMIIERVDDVDDFSDAAQVFIPTESSNVLYFLNGSQVFDNEYYFDTLKLIDRNTKLICFDSVFIIASEDDPNYYGFYYNLKNFEKI